jgi:hypothetical protein
MPLVVVLLGLYLRTVTLVDVAHRRDVTGSVCPVVTEFTESSAVTYVGEVINGAIVSNVTRFTTPLHEAHGFTSATRAVVQPPR